MDPWYERGICFLLRFDEILFNVQRVMGFSERAIQYYPYFTTPHMLEVHSVPIMTSKRLHYAAPKRLAKIKPVKEQI